LPGARLFGKRAGTWGDVGVLSFGGSKLLTAGRGGALFTNNPDVVQRARLYSHRGNEAYPLSELQAAVLLPQLETLDERNRKRADSVAYLSKLLTDIGGLRRFQNAFDDAEPGYYKLGLQYDPEAFGGLSRDRFVAAMRAEGVALDSGFRALHLIHGSRRFRKADGLPIASDADSRVLVLHHPVLLESMSTFDRIADTVKRIRKFAREIITG
jgi:dTDP-4-amino-4,6-dideoxygalactose transaminase